MIMAEDQTIIASYKFTFNEMKTAQGLHGAIRKRIETGGFLLLLAFGLVLVGWKALTEGVPTRDLVTLAIVLAIALPGIFYFQKLAVSDAFSRRGDKDRFITFVFSPQAITSTISRMVTTEYKWETFIKVRRTAKGFLFYTRLDSYFWVPFEAFASMDDAETVADLSRRLAAKYSE